MKLCIYGLESGNQNRPQAGFLLTRPQCYTYIEKQVSYLLSNFLCGPGAVVVAHEAPVKIVVQVLQLVATNPCAGQFWIVPDHFEAVNDASVPE
jgi:hypothetical protein